MSLDNLDQVDKAKGKGVVMGHEESVRHVEGEEEAGDLLEELNSTEAGTLILEPQEDFNSAITGYHPPSNRLIYDGHALIEIYGKRDGMEYHDAIEFMDYNICFGPGTPIVYYEWDELDDMLESE